MQLNIVLDDKYFPALCRQYGVPYTDGGPENKAALLAAFRNTLEAQLRAQHTTLLARTFAFGQGEVDITIS
jgi:hypothetical protein